MIPSEQDGTFNAMIGELDFILSQMIAYSKSDLGSINRQTLKHHAEDMKGAAESILKRLEVIEKQRPDQLHQREGLSRVEADELDSVP